MKYILLLLFICTLPLASAAHFIVGTVNNALDGQDSNGKEVVLWNPSRGITDNVTDLIGVGGNSGAENIYLIDCEMLNTPCRVNDEVRLKVLNEGDGYISYEVNLSVTGAGYDVAPNITLNSKPSITSILIDDFIGSAGEIDLQAASVREVSCGVIVKDFDGEDLQNTFAEFYHSSSGLGQGEDNNKHYTNNTCNIDYDYGDETESFVVCNFSLWYYANPGTWSCFFQTEDNLSISINSSNTSLVNTLLSVGVPDSIDYSTVDAKKVSEETELNITNYGNVIINLSLTGYGLAEGDGLAMGCDIGNISIEHQKYNLTESNPGELDLGQTDLVYENMSGQTVIREFNLDYRTQDLLNEASNSTYWRIYVPLKSEGNCQGNIIFGASQDSEN
jgi:hypothetical protein